MKVLIADDHPLVREALAQTVRALRPDADVLQAGDRAAAQALIELHTPALALLDLHMPGLPGTPGLPGAPGPQGVQAMQWLAALHARWPALALVVVSGDDDPVTVRAALATGALAFLPKGETPAVLQQALRLVLEGGRYLPPQALAGWDRGQPDAAALTPRQRDVLACLMRGQPNKQIARELGIGEGTVKLHIAAVLRALQARNRTEAVVRARALGL